MKDLNDDGDTLWNKVNSHYQDKKNLLKNKIFNNKFRKYKSWKYNFNKELDISLFQGGFQELKQSIQDKKYGQDKYLQTNPLTQMLNSLPLIYNDDENFLLGKMSFYKDCGFQSKQQKKKLGLCGILGVNNVSDAGDRLRASAWGGINDTVNNEMNLKINYFSPNLPPETNVSNLQFKGRYQFTNLEQTEYLYQCKYSTVDQDENWIYSFNGKLYINEVRGIDRQTGIFGISRKSILNKKSGQSWSSTSQLKQTFAFDFTRKNLFFKSTFFKNYQKLFTFNIGENGLLYCNFINHYSKGMIISNRQMLKNEQFQINYQPGYINNLYDEENSGLMHTFQNTTKMEIIKSLPNFDPFIQIHSSFQLKQFRLADLKLYKAFIQDKCKVVVSAGGTVDLGFVKIGLLYNILDVVPYVFGRNQKQQFQNFQVYFSQ